MNFRLLLLASTVLLSTGTLTRAATNTPPVITNSAPFGTNTIPVLSMKGGHMGLPPKPGIYKTEPYTCMLKVPGFQHDDASVHSAGKALPEMPTHHPEQRLIPQGKGQSLGLKRNTNSIPDIHLELPKKP